MKVQDKKEDDIKMLEILENLKYWQRQLRLDHLDIKVRWFGDEEEADADGTSGYCKTYTLSHSAFISLRPMSMFRTSSRDTFCNDHEVILVHELLHVRDALWRENPELSEFSASLDIIYEIALDATAEALVRARRGIIR